MAKWRYRSKYHRRNISFHQQCIEAVVVWTTAAFLYARNHFTIPPAGRFRPLPRSPPHLISVVQKPEIRMEVPSMGFNYRQKRKEFEQNWAKALKQYIAAGMTQEQITAMREFDEELFRQEGLRKPNQCGPARPQYPTIQRGGRLLSRPLPPLGCSHGKPVSRFVPKGHRPGSQSGLTGLHWFETGGNCRDIAHITDVCL